MKNNSLPPREQWHPSGVKLRDIYAKKPDAPFFHKTFGLWFCLDTWYEQGLDPALNLDDFFHFDPPGHHELGELGWCEAAFSPGFEEKIIETRGNQEIVQDIAGRYVLYFTGKRQGFMPEYLDHPVKDQATWEENVKWRLNPADENRYLNLHDRMNIALQKASQGLMIQQNLIGGYMYLRSLIGPENLLYFFYDNPKLVHDCMKTWLELSDAVISKHQQYVTLDELYLAEDICYNVGPLISPDMINEFLMPYYQQLLKNTQDRQLDKKRHLYVQIDTDGFAVSVIDVYRKGLGMDVMSPFEVASGCDVVQIAKDHPDLIISGGIDKRILAQGPDAIDRELDRILPFMRKRGGYIPTCDHGVPPEVKWKDYLHYRKRCMELGG